MANRVIELAIEALEARKVAIQEEIRKLRLGLRGGRRRAATDNGLARRKRRMTAAAREAQSLKMKEYWARKKASGPSGAGTVGKKSARR
jgi:hypothetical protein